MHTERIFFIVFCIFCSSAFLKLFYLLYFHLRLANHKNKSSGSAIQPPVSVIICARNEDTNLKKNLPKILAQDYPQFEVIVVDDNSEDGTTEYLFFLSQKEPRLKRVKVGNTNRMMAGKKFPLTLGLKAATYETVVLTDADCYPAGENWLKEIVSRYAPGKTIVLGYGAYEKAPGFLNKVIRYETVLAAMNYLSFALARCAYMGVGRNLSYHKQLFFDNGGFFEHREIPSGDDDLFINKVAKKRNTTIAITKDSFTYSEPKETWNEWVDQKTRHLSTGRYYRFGHKLLLGLQTISHTLLWFTGIFLLVCGYEYWYVILGTILVRWIVMRIVISKTLFKLDEADLRSFVEIFDLLQLYYSFRFAKAALVKSKYRWD